MKKQSIILQFVLALALGTFSAWAGTIDVKVSSGADDAEESENNATTFLDSSDLELVEEVEGAAQGKQTVGMRFAKIEIPQGAKITAAYVQFTSKDPSKDECSLTIKGQAADNPPTFKGTTPHHAENPTNYPAAFEGADISTRATTTASVKWSPAPWDVQNRADVGERTPDIAPIIQEIVNRQGWAGGNSVVVIITGTGTRNAAAFEYDGGAGWNGTGTSAPLLHVVWEK